MTVVIINSTACYDIPREWKNSCKTVESNWGDGRVYKNKSLDRTKGKK